MAGVGAPVQTTQAPVAADSTVDRYELATGSLSGDQLRDAIALLDVLGVGLKNAFLVFGSHGLTVHSNLCGEQAYVCIAANKFTSYSWRPDQAQAHPVFLANVDSRRGLLDAFRMEKKRKVQHVAFTIVHGPPNSVLEQHVSFTGEDDTTGTYALVKHEFRNYSIMLPGQHPEFTASFNRAQITRLQSVCKPPADIIVFELARGTGLTVSSASARVGFTPVFDPAGGKPSTSEQILLAAQGPAKRPPARLLICSGHITSFKIALEPAAGLRAVIQKLKQIGGDLVVRFHLSPLDACMLSVSSSVPVGLTVFMFCSRVPFYTPCVPDGGALIASGSKRAVTSGKRPVPVGGTLLGGPWKKSKHGTQEDDASSM